MEKQFHFVGEFENQKAKIQKDACFDKIKTFTIGDVVSMGEISEYLLALLDYQSGSLYEDVFKCGFSKFILKEIDLIGLELWWVESLANSKVSTLNTRAKIDFYKEQLIKTKWYPPIIFDPRNVQILDGHHRAFVLKELGMEKVIAFVGG